MTTGNAVAADALDLPASAAGGQRTARSLPASQPRVAEAAPADAAPASAAELAERTAIEEALTRAAGVMSRAAAEMGLSRQALYRRMERLGLSLERRLR